MLFNSLHFLLFLPIVVTLYYLLPGSFRWVLILISSCYFYMSFVPEYILILFAIILIDYTAARFIEAAPLPAIKKSYLVISIMANLLLLAYFKYFNFLDTNFAHLFNAIGIDYQVENTSIILPIGLSFHTLQSMGYTIEVYRGKQKAERHLGYFANYVLFFPQMVAGPIERYETLGSELRKQHEFNYQNFSDGLKLMLVGFVYKMCVADNLAPYINYVYESPELFARYDLFVAMFLFSFQIYADFAGYSLIALGCALLLGIRIMDNFKTPYFSKSIGEFWTRWHISLSTWFRDYLYIPLGGSRVMFFRWGFNILVVFMVSGLWHGASWTFVIWGLLHAFVRIVEVAFSRVTHFKIKEGWSLINLALLLKTFLITSVIWVFFRAENFNKAILILQKTFGHNQYNYSEIDYRVPILVAILLVCLELFLYNSRVDKIINPLHPFFRWVIYALLLFVLLAMAGTQKLSFIYFQF